MNALRTKPPALSAVEDPIVAAVDKLVPAGTAEPWCGTTGALLKALDPLVHPNIRQSSVFWPQTPLGLGRRIEHLGLGFAARGLSVRRRTSPSRGIIISRAEPDTGKVA